MEKILDIRAGKIALDHIRNKGLSPTDIRAITGASGAAKWLGIYGLHRAIFSQWLRDITHPVFLFGTSIGAWALAVGAQKYPATGFDRLKKAYIYQCYRGRVTPEKVAQESYRVLDMVFAREQIDEVLNHPHFTVAFSAVRCRGPLASEDQVILGGGLIGAFLLNLFSRKTQPLFFERTLFHSPLTSPDTGIALEFKGGILRKVPLTPENFSQAILASGSIPILMKGIRDIPGALHGIYRDGGVLDYHPSLPLRARERGLILFPHFYPWIIPGWFDKFGPRRKAVGSVLDRTVLVSPSQDFVKRLPFSRIPDRKDFLRFQGRDDERFRVWEAAAKMSLELGDAFVSVAKSGRIAEWVTPF